jgi:hypothetical protein
MSHNRFELKKMPRKTKVPYKQIITRVTVYDYKRLEFICRKYKFRSLYEVVQYLIHCFLRVADKEHDQEIEPLPVEIERMFNLDTLKRIIKMIPRQGELFPEEEQKDEISEMFDDFSNTEAPAYGEGEKHRKSNRQVKYEKEDKI